MSVEQFDVVDIVSIDPNTDHVVLTISDHLDWSDTTKHQLTLQEKLNRYLAFVEGGEILERYPDAKSRKVTFKVVFKFRPDAEGIRFLERARAVVEAAGFSLRQEVFAESYDN